MQPATLLTLKIMILKYRMFRINKTNFNFSMTFYFVHYLLYNEYVKTNYINTITEKYNNIVNTKL